MHDKCDLSEIDMNLYQTCDLFDNYILECSTDKCGGQKQVCDCNVYDEFFIYFDQKRCKWNLKDQEPCPSTRTSTTTRTTPRTTTRTTPRTTTGTTTITTTTARIISQTTTSTIALNTTTTNPSTTQFCDVLDSSWMCSMDNKQHSLCIKFCSKNDVTSYKRCVCKHSGLCFWAQKGQKCPEEKPYTLPSDFSSNPNYNLASLSSILREMNFEKNHGHIHVKFQL